MRMDLHDDPAVVLISSAVKISEDEAVGKLFRLWCWADRHTKDGRAPAITIPWIDRYVGKRGFADAMVLAGWLVVTPEGITIPNFDRHNGESAKSRANATERKRTSRTGHAPTVTDNTGPCHADSVTNVTPPTAEFRDQRREEKRRTNPTPPPEQALSQDSSIPAEPAPPRASSPPGEFPKADDPRVTALHGIVCASRCRASVLDAQQWVSEGLTEPQLLEAISRARGKKSPAEVIPLKFLQCFVADVRAGVGAAGPYDAKAVRDATIAAINAKEGHATH